MRLDHVASCVVNADHGIRQAAERERITYLDRHRAVIRVYTARSRPTSTISSPFARRVICVSLKRSLIGYPHDFHHASQGTNVAVAVY